MLRIRDVYPGSAFFPFRIRIKELKYLTQKIVSMHVWTSFKKLETMRYRRKSSKELLEITRDLM
jgi:hypothetical protein